jgi:la-related protein 6
MAKVGDCEAGSESDGGYVTPSEFTFADDERPPSPQEKHSSELPVSVSAELQQRIIEQVEWYFSDENLLKDSFLMKHIQRNKQGLVSLKLVASFRKVKSLTKDWRVVQTSLLQSTQLELNDDRNKVRRVAAVPEVDYSHALRTVIIHNYPDPQPQSEDIEREFSKYGEVTLVRILYPGRSVPLDVKPSRKRHPAIGKSLCILVEFESQEGARKACARFNSQLSWRDQLSVSLLSQKEGRDDGAKMRDVKKPEDGPPHFLSAVSSPDHRNARESSPVRNKRRHRGSPAVSRKFLSPESSREKDYSSDSGCSVGRTRSPRLSPEPMRKFPSDQTLVHSRRSPSRLHESRIIRQPWGPDGSRGFLRNINPVPVVSICS